MKEYDIVVIGAGAGGLTAAITAKGFGRSVLLIEKDRTGGECTWSGCIPSKALINYAKEIHTVKKHVSDYQVDALEPLKRVQKVIADVYAEETPDKLSALGIDVLMGSAKFVSDDLIQVGEEKIRGKRFILATGSKPLVPRIKGIDKVSYLTNESIFKLDKLPNSLMIIGTGAISIELAQAMNRLGVKVTVLGRSKGILKKEEQDLSNLLMERLVKEGVNFITGITFGGVHAVDMGVSLTYIENNVEKKIEAEKILLATGRRPVTEGMDLEKVGVTYDKKGIQVAATLKTSNSKIYAVGDVVGPYQFSHMANVQGIRAVQNALFPIKRKLNYDHVAWCTFTDPELAHAGLTEAEARDKYSVVQVYQYDYSQLDRVKTKPGSLGTIKVILDKKGKILGTSILGERAGELISEVQVLKTLGLSYKKLLNVIHPYPTYSEALNKISKSVAVDALFNNPLVKLFRKGK